MIMAWTKVAGANEEKLMDMRYILEVGLTGLFAGYVWGEEGLNNWVDGGAMYQDGKVWKGIGLGDKKLSSTLKPFTYHASGIDFVSFGCKCQTGLNKNGKLLVGSLRKYRLRDSWIQVLCHQNIHTSLLLSLSPPSLLPSPPLLG